MTTKTRRELIYEALDNLGILVPGQAPSTNNYNKMDGMVDPALEQMAGLGIYYVQDPGTLGAEDGEIEASAFIAVAAYLANAAAAKFNLANDVKLKALAIEAENTLRILSAASPTRRTLRIDTGIPTSRNDTYNDVIQ